MELRILGWDHPGIRVGPKSNRTDNIKENTVWIYRHVGEEGHVIDAETGMMQLQAKGLRIAGNH